MTEIEELISEVERNPCLWNVGCSNYQNKTQRDLAWEDICKRIIPHWNDLNMEDRKQIREYKKKQWNNVRDGYRKYLNRNKNTPVPKKKFIYGDDLQFLLPILKNNKSRERNRPSESHDDNDEDNEAFEIELKPYTEDSYEDDEEEETKSFRKYRTTEKRNKAQQKYENDEIPYQILNITKQKTDDEDNYQDVDSQFLLSFRDYMKGMTRSQKLNFKLGMIQLIQHVTEEKVSDPFSEC
ncbi:uncharacterized protein LOC114240325 isoform X2 [Bombyx mandarina]|uniref:Uncharacterized protein LOC114240325 isoform X1 n=1 Tax=Bombyx mandarina TaxID=7092 RepID=A0A6J2JBZ9_BOMMA|nr:uncharacterized protein LOC114240325 isoform X1 [Bombyx mandarina]XP_028026632.1 uncharacterized protein LOC114240325 isoform X2 [Bombyx mandarina]